jgi:thymidine kinase
MSLDIVMGPMFAGKSSLAIQRLRREMYLNTKCCVITSALDTRYDSAGRSLQTHDESGGYPAIGLNVLQEAFTLVAFLDASFVVIDEAQFFPDLYEAVMMMVEGYKKKVLVVGLDGDSNRMPFDQIQRLISKADTCEKLTALCSMCKDGTPGIFSLRFASAEGQICVGGKDKYAAVCRKHYVGYHATAS